MKKLFKSFTTISAVILIGTLFNTGTASAAPQENVPPELQTSLISTWTAYGVSTDVQNALIVKLRAREYLDSMLGGQPDSIKMIAHTTTSVQEYADGSINVLSMEAPLKLARGGVSTQSVTTCSGGGTNRIYTDCTVSGWFTGVRLSFLADYQLSTTSQARILGYRAPTVSCTLPLTCTGPIFEVTRLTQNGSLAARVSATTYWSGLGSGTTRLSLSVINLSATTN